MSEPTQSEPQRARRQDVEDLERANTQLERLASIDHLTGLLNRRGLEAALAAANRRVDRSGSGLVAILLDCDDFKAVNSRFGHAVGDEVLRQVCDRVRGAARSEDYLARVGGDEVLVLLTEVRIAEGMEIAERIRLAICTDAVKAAGADVDISASLGVEDVTGCRGSIGDILAHTRLALQKSKIGKNRVSGADGGSPALAATKSLLDGDVWAAAQPIRDLVTGDVVGFEMLSRGPEGPFSEPQDFFRICRELDVLGAVDLRCLEICLDATRAFPAGTRIHANLFPATLLEQDVDRLLAIAGRLHEDHELCVELSEHYFVGDPSRLRDRVTSLRDAGIRIAIENVGFGRSALETLVVLEPDFVKIDRRLIQGAVRDRGSLRFLERILNVVRVLGSTPMAEGIEEKAGLELARDAGIPLGQGFLWGAPARV